MAKQKKRTAIRPRAAGPEFSVPSPPELLIRQLRGGRVVLFVGAGLSAQAGLPTWRALLQEVVDATVRETHPSPEARAELDRMLVDGKLLELADHCKDKLGPGGYTQLLMERLADTGRPVPDVHKLAMRLPFAACITTNYDKFLERAYAETRGALPKTLTNRDTEALGRLLFDGAPFILKAHGDLDKPESLVLTTRDYRDLIHGNAAFSTAFSAILLTHSIFFVGYSLGDPDFNLLLDRQLLTFRGFVPERYALMGGIGKIEEEYLWRACQIRVIAYPSGRHESVSQFLNALALAVSAAPERTPVAPAPVPTVRMPAITTAIPTFRPGLAPSRSTPAARPSYRLSLGWKDGAVHGTLVHPDGKAIGPERGPVANWSHVIAALRDTESTAGLSPKDAGILGTAMGELVGRELLQALTKAARRSDAVLVELVLTREVEWLPWELLSIGSRSIGSRSLAESVALFRAPVGISAEARGTPALNWPLRALVIGDTLADSKDGWGALPAAAEEAREIARRLQKSGIGEVRLLLGRQATLEAVRAVFEEQAPDLFHFAGHAWYDDHDAFLLLADGKLTTSLVRPWLTRRPPAFVFLNSHYTAFISAGVVQKAPRPDEIALRAGSGGRAGFADLAMRSGVGAFLGSFSGKVTDTGARDFAFAVIDRLLAGQAMAESVHGARRVPADSADLTALLFSLHGDGYLRLAPP